MDLKTSNHSQSENNISSENSEAKENTQEMDTGDNNISEAIPIQNSMDSHKRLSSSNSAGTSFTSGLGTSVSESFLDVDSEREFGSPKALDSPHVDDEKPLDLSVNHSNHSHIPAVPLENGSLDFDLEPNGANGRDASSSILSRPSTRSRSQGSKIPRPLPHKASNVVGSADLGDTTLHVPHIELTSSDPLEPVSEDAKEEPETQDENQESLFSFHREMIGKINLLPIPPALKCFLSYYRT